MSLIGQSVKRVDAREKVTGEADFPGDLVLPNMLHMKTLFAGRPHAIIRRIDTSKVQRLPGVVLVLTAQDVPVNEYGLIMPDQPVLCGPGSTKVDADRVRWIGDQVALVIAETEEIGAQALKLIEVDYEDLPLVEDPLLAISEDAPLVHPQSGSNIFCRYRIRKGEVDAGFAEAAVVVEGEYRTPAQEHAYLQPEAGVGYIDEDGRVAIKVAGQWTHEDQKQIAHALGLDPDQVRVSYAAIGGAFGGREDMSIQISLALAAMRLKEMGIDRPVKTIWSRRESIIGHHKRHPYVIRTKWGADRNGKLLAASVEIFQDGGAYAYTSTKVLANSTLMCTGPYEIPNVQVDAYSIYTTHVPGGAFRGFGGPQGAFVAESQINKLALALGIDAVEIRARNVLGEGALLSVGTPLPKGVSIGQVVEACALEAGWKRSDEGWQRPAAPAAGAAHRHGIGYACGFKNVGFSFGAPERCFATIELRGSTEIEQAILYHASAEVGQGTHTVMTQMAAEALGLPMEKIQLVVSDTATSDNSGSVSASRMTFMSGNAIRGAAAAALEAWKAEERPARASYQYVPPPTTPLDKDTGKSEPNYAYGYVAEAVVLGVDLETGHLWLEEVVCADDVGQAINPQLVQGQIEGAVVQAYGYAVLENFLQEGGGVQTDELSTYLIPTVYDVPTRVKSVIIEQPDPLGPWGARGVGEMPYIPLVPAITAALHDATGVWFDEFPLTPDRVLKKLREHGVAA